MHVKQETVSEDFRVKKTDCFPPLVEKTKEKPIQVCSPAREQHDYGFFVGEFVRKSLRSASNVNGLEKLSIRYQVIVIDACQTEAANMHRCRVRIHKPYVRYRTKVSLKTVHSCFF